MSVRQRIHGPVALVVAALLLSAGTPASAAARTGLPDPPPVQSPAEALRQDLKLVAEGKGWTLAQAAADRKAAEAVGDVAAKVARERPEIFVGSAVNPLPGGAPTLYVKGPADAFVDRLVAGADVDIDVVDGQPYSFGELEERQLTVHKALVAYGFTSVATSVDIVGAGRIPAQVTETPGVDSRPEAVLSAMPQGLRPHIDLAVRDEPVTSLEFGFGGERVRGGGSQCTSGWPILANGVLPGITTAGHCDGMNEIDWTDAGLSFPITPQFQHRRAWGDVEYHFGVPVLAGIFYASSADVREARSVEPVAAISLGESVCQYGRSSNVRHCTPDVDSVSVTCTFAPFPFPTERLVGTDNDVGISGDSGGGWSFNDTAYGSHVGNCDNGEVFSAADYYDEALGVQVWLAP
ncbi:S1 family peptidase [Nonomuraea sp. NPDC050478]|jgi:hypothetical protein|uniref:S1 family peptidase n=1 Tax=unclassified Nonomuraea TaxID=2593643 RepID=UPI001C9BDD14|nr:S1 family peptidase [Nonomuraea sp. C10]